MCTLARFPTLASREPLTERGDVSSRLADQGTWSPPDSVPSLAWQWVADAHHCA